MTTTPRIAVIYYSATGNVHDMAQALGSGAQSGGAEILLRRVLELAPDDAIDANPAWRAHLEATRDVIPEATHDDLLWADGYAFGSPTRFGNVAGQLKQFLDSTGGLWSDGKLADKVATGFTSAQNSHGGNEATILAPYLTMMHWGAIIVAPGYTDDAFSAAGGNPYGTSYPSGTDDEAPGELILAGARAQGRRLVEITARLTKPSA